MAISSTHRGRVLAGICALVVAGSLMGASPEPSAGETQPGCRRARRSAEEVLLARGEALVDGSELSAPSAFTAVAPSYRTAEQAHRTALAGFGDALDRRGVGYSSAAVRLIDPRVTDFTGRTATLIAIDHTTLHFDDGSGLAEEHQVERQFTMELDADGRWRVIDESPTRPSLIPASTDVGRDGGWVDSGPDSRDALVDPDAGDATGVAGQAADHEASAYNKTAIANYAATYVFSPNPNYRTYSQDCTNFVSQAVKSGGWANRDDGSRTSNGSWYYGSFTWTTTYTWRLIQNGP